jgi:uncharacterized cupin superfamily protein
MTDPMTLGPATYTGTNSYRSETSLTSNGEVSVENGANVTFEAADAIYLTPGFNAMSGSVFTARITAVDCSAQ